MKRWYSVTIVVGLEVINAANSQVLIEEQVHLVEAVNAEDANVTGKLIGEDHCRIDDGIEWNGKTAKRFFGGVRRVVETQNMDGDARGQPISGCEITYSEFVLKSRADLTKLLSGEEVSVQYVNE
jgi:hypothetical protein